MNLDPRSETQLSDLWQSGVCRLSDSSVSINTAYHVICYLSCYLLRMLFCGLQLWVTGGTNLVSSGVTGLQPGPQPNVFLTHIFPLCAFTPFGQCVLLKFLALRL